LLAESIITNKIMITIQQFKDLQKKSSHSFHQQKALIKKLMLGKIAYCEVCGAKLELKLPDHTAIAGVFCAKGCTDIQLDIS